MFQRRCIVVLYVSLFLNAKKQTSYKINACVLHMSAMLDRYLFYYLNRQIERVKGLKCILLSNQDFKIKQVQASGKEWLHLKKTLLSLTQERIAESFRPSLRYNDAFA